MRTAIFSALAFLLLAAAPAPHRQHAPSSRLKFVDLIPAFDRIWNETKDLPDDKRVDAFEAKFAKVLPGFYSAERTKEYQTPEQHRTQVLRGLKQYPDRRAGILRVSRQFRSLVAPAQRQFESVFGPMRGYPPIYLVDSFREFDGGTRDLPEGNRLLFGADMIDELYKDKPIKPFIEHELFHLLHHRTFPECDPVWCNLWEEGLATYVASKLNPGAGDEALLLTIPVPLRPAVEAHKQEAICAVRARLESKDPKAYAPLFMGGGKPLSENLPQRFGYYVGLLVVSDAGKHRTLKQLAALTPDQAHRVVEQSLERMATCPPATAA
jgi:hypothetical protein